MTHRRLFLSLLSFAVCVAALTNVTAVAGDGNVKSGATIQAMTMKSKLSERLLCEQGLRGSSQTICKTERAPKLMPSTQESLIK
jgi:hypothetical protein